MSSKDERNRTQVIDKIAKMDEPRRSIMQRVHDIIVAAAPRTETADLVRNARLCRISEYASAGDIAQRRTSEPRDH